MNCVVSKRVRESGQKRATFSIYKFTSFIYSKRLSSSPRAREYIHLNEWMNGAQHFCAASVCTYVPVCLWCMCVYSSCVSFSTVRVFVVIIIVVSHFSFRDTRHIFFALFSMEISMDVLLFLSSFCVRFSQRFGFYFTVHFRALFFLIFIFFMLPAHIA